MESQASIFDMNHPVTYLVVAIILSISYLLFKINFDKREKAKMIKRDQDKVYSWLMKEFRGSKEFEFRTTKAISSGTHLSEDRVREVAIADQRIHKSTGSMDDRWTVKAKPLVKE